MMSQSCIICLWLNGILNKINRTREQASSVFKHYYQTQTPDIVVQVIKTEYPGEKRLNKQQILKIVRRFEEMGSIQWLL